MAATPVDPIVIKLTSGSEQVVGEVRGLTHRRFGNRKNRTVGGTGRQKWGVGPQGDEGTLRALFDPADAGQALVILSSGGIQMVIEFGQASGDLIRTSADTGFDNISFDGSNVEEDWTLEANWFSNSGFADSTQP